MEIQGRPALPAEVQAPDCQREILVVHHPEELAELAAWVEHKEQLDKREHQRLYPVAEAVALARQAAQDRAVQDLLAAQERQLIGAFEH
jgi:hypothetical protein